MHEITEQSVLKVFQEEKRISWDDFAEKQIFFDIKGNNRDIQLRNVLADLIKGRFKNAGAWDKTGMGNCLINLLVPCNNQISKFIS